MTAMAGRPEMLTVVLMFEDSKLSDGKSERNERKGAGQHLVLMAGAKRWALDASFVRTCGGEEPTRVTVLLVVEAMIKRRLMLELGVGDWLHMTPGETEEGD